MKIAYFDCGYGAAGDMLLGALISAGLPVKPWLKELDKIALPPGSFKIEISDVMRCSLAAKKVDVHYEKYHSHGYEDSHSHEHSLEHTHSHDGEHSHSHDDHHGHDHEHVHSHEDGHSHAHSHTDSPDHSHQHEHDRNLPEVLRIITASEITPMAKELASKIFTTLGEAEAKVHGTTVDKVHFHEVGAVDAIIDIVGFAIAYDMMQIESSTVSPLPVGSGKVQSAHGWFPVPGPAVLNILANAGVPIASAPFKHECLTPTGAAILCTVAKEAAPMPSMTISNTGYGAGTFNPNGFPNVCRVIIGDAIELAPTKLESRLAIV
ncbi:MAG: pyridinium-3,5-bisthiocarboxylic acid mononucleotide nickel chelatase [Cyanobacteriota bacterium erpe_2018_sw_21hr_WHONDRS-SW48-000092_B_bin.40]|jgi:uncharacterized protein (DUF111 family)|nr:pyridinium-3,5-bisthiocarboxylic acid mononucleotide nickel chelatase [Cyanobacteriota bacterium erpe_2018_sw_21hr_WHONDRS-SW48-000092_B_bin.40]